MSSDIPQLSVLVYHGDSPTEMEFLRTCLEEKAGPYRFTVQPAATGDELLGRLKSETLPDIVLFNLPDEYAEASSLFRLIARTRALHPTGVLITGTYKDDVRLIVQCIEEGVDDYISKGSNIKQVPQDLFHIYQRTMARHRNALQCTQHPPRYVGKTIYRIDASIPNIIDSAIGTIFVSGRSGTGKEVVADLFRARLPSTIPFIKVNCGAIAPSLMEAEFFGYARGAFTGARVDKPGLFEQASGGWLFMDEVANLTREAQAALLRVIENQEIIRVGESIPRRISVRFISATNENLEQLVSEGRFRLDLWQRLSEKIIYLPPLRERPEEIDDLVLSFCTTMRGGPYAITDPTMDILRRIKWKEGNVRQLRNCLRAMTEHHAEKVLTPVTIPPWILRELMPAPPPEPEFVPEDSGSDSRHNSITLRWPRGQRPGFEELSEQLLMQMVERASRDKHVKSLRTLASSIGMVRTTLANRLRAIARKQADGGSPPDEAIAPWVN